MAHLTAGDITPIGHIKETTYGTKPDLSKLVSYGDIREGGNITPTDTVNPYVNWRYSNATRGFTFQDYVKQNTEAGFNDAIEVRDQAGWTDILDYAGFFTSETPTAKASLPSRTIQFGFEKGTSRYALTYIGCKTDTLRISADVPGGVAKFDETVLASYRDRDTTTFGHSPTTGRRPIQWTGGVFFDGREVFPQSFSITVKNNLGRADSYDTDLDMNRSVALVEGRQEIEAEFTLWMEDFSNLTRGMGDDIDGGHSIFKLTLGIDNPVTLILNGEVMADGTNQALVQDKQLETFRIRVAWASYVTPTAVSSS